MKKMTKTKLCSVYGRECVSGMQQKRNVLTLSNRYVSRYSSYGRNVLCLGMVATSLVPQADAVVNGRGAAQGVVLPDSTTTDSVRGFGKLFRKKTKSSVSPMLGGDRKKPITRRFGFLKTGASSSQQPIVSPQTAETTNNSSIATKTMKGLMATYRKCKTATETAFAKGTSRLFMETEASDPQLHRAFKDLIRLSVKDVNAFNSADASKQIKQLVKGSTDINVLNGDGETILDVANRLSLDNEYSAVGKKFVAAIQEVGVCRGFDISQRLKPGSDTSLHVFCRSCCMGNVKFNKKDLKAQLTRHLEDGADINALGADGETVLDAVKRFALVNPKSKYPAMLQTMLVAAGAKSAYELLAVSCPGSLWHSLVNSIAENQDKPPSFFLPIYRNCSLSGVNINARNANGLTPLDLLHIFGSFRKKQFSDQVAKFRSQGALTSMELVFTGGGNDFIPLNVVCRALACSREPLSYVAVEQAVDSLLRRGERINELNENGETVLDMVDSALKCPVSSSFTLPFLRDVLIEKGATPGVSSKTYGQGNPEGHAALCVIESCLLQDEVVTDQSWASLAEVMAKQSTENLNVRDHQGRNTLDIVCNILVLCPEVRERMTGIIDQMRRHGARSGLESCLVRLATSGPAIQQVVAKAFSAGQDADVAACLVEIKRLVKSGHDIDELNTHNLTVMDLVRCLRNSKTTTFDVVSLVEGLKSLGAHTSGELRYGLVPKPITVVATDNPLNASSVSNSGVVAALPGAQQGVETNGGETIIVPQEPAAPKGFFLKRFFYKPKFSSSVGLRIPKRVLDPNVNDSGLAALRTRVTFLNKILKPPKRKLFNLLFPDGILRMFRKYREKQRNNLRKVLKKLDPSRPKQSLRELNEILWRNPGVGSNAMMHGRPLLHWLIENKLWRHVWVALRSGVDPRVTDGDMKNAAHVLLANGDDLQPSVQMSLLSVMVDAFGVPLASTDHFQANRLLGS